MTEVKIFSNRNKNIQVQAGAGEAGQHAGVPAGGGGGQRAVHLHRLRPQHHPPHTHRQGQGWVQTVPQTLNISAIFKQEIHRTLPSVDALLKGWPSYQSHTWTDILLVKTFNIKHVTSSELFLYPPPSLIMSPNYLCHVQIVQHVCPGPGSHLADIETQLTHSNIQQKSNLSFGFEAVARLLIHSSDGWWLIAWDQDTCQHSSHCIFLHPPAAILLSLPCLGISGPCLAGLRRGRSSQWSVIHKNSPSFLIFNSHA